MLHNEPPISLLGRPSFERHAPLTCLSEEVSHSFTHQKREYRYCDRYADHCSKLYPQEYVGNVAQQIDCEKSDSNPVPPPPAAPESHCCRHASHADGAHQHNSPSAHDRKAFARSWIESPHRFKKTSRKEQRDER